MSPRWSHVSVLDHRTARARRLVEREATFGMLEDFGLVSRTRGGSPLRSSNPRCFPTHHILWASWAPADPALVGRQALGRPLGETLRRRSPWPILRAAA
jgi:hypothetical protein